MSRFGRKTAARAAVLLAVGILAYAGSIMAVTEQVQAQIGEGDFWLFQPQQQGPVGRAWCNAEHTVEYWAYVVGEYQWSGPANGAANRWQLAVQQASCANYPTFNCFKAAVLAMPEMAGKTIRFENHSVVGDTIDN